MGSRNQHILVPSWRARKKIEHSQIIFKPFEISPRPKRFRSSCSSYRRTLCHTQTGKCPHFLVPALDFRFHCCRHCVCVGAATATTISSSSFRIQSCGQRCCRRRPWWTWRPRTGWTRREGQSRGSYLGTFED